MAKALREVTKEEWLSCQYAGEMMKWLRTADGRKLRLFACACCRQIWDLMTEDARQLVEAAERWADGHISRKELEAIRRRIAPDLPRDTHGLLDRPSLAALATAIPGKAALSDLIYNVAISRPGASVYGNPVLEQAHARHRHLLHDVFDYLFLDTTLAPAWPTAEVTRLARSAYDGGTFDELPVLADALEEAGCTNADLLAHCRGPGPHVRGCWAVDLLLGKQ
jgi:hypothetical protein